MKNLFKIFRRGESTDHTTPQRITPPPLARSMIQGYLQSMRDQLALQGLDDGLPLASTTRDRLEADCTHFYLQSAGALVKDSGQAYRAGYDFYLARNGAEQPFPEDFWPRKVGFCLANIATKYEESRPLEGDDGLLYVA